MSETVECFLSVRVQLCRRALLFWNEVMVDLLFGRQHRCSLLKRTRSLHTNRRLSFNSLCYKFSLNQQTLRSQFDLSSNQAFPPALGGVVGFQQPGVEISSTYVPLHSEDYPPLSTSLRQLPITATICYSTDESEVCLFLIDEH